MTTDYLRVVGEAVLEGAISVLLRDFLKKVIAT